MKRLLWLAIYAGLFFLGFVIAVNTTMEKAAGEA